MYSKHTIAYCDHCETEMVRCGTCGNNGCNGSSGPIPGYDMSCPDCPEAHTHQDILWKNPSSISFSKDER